MYIGVESWRVCKGSEIVEWISLSGEERLVEG